jgi:O-antigen ligase
MFAGFLVSRVALSISMFLFGINAIRDIPPRQWLRQKWWLLGLAWVGVYALSWFWSADKATWGTRLEVKLPFLLLPLAFAFMAPFTRKQKEQLTVTIALMMLATALYSIFFLVRDPAYTT